MNHPQHPTSAVRGKAAAHLRAWPGGSATGVPAIPAGLLALMAAVMLGAATAPVDAAPETAPVAPVKADTAPATQPPPSREAPPAPAPAPADKPDGKADTASAAKPAAPADVSGKPAVPVDPGSAPDRSGKTGPSIRVRGKNTDALGRNPVATLPQAKRKVVVLKFDGVVDPGLAEWLKAKTAEVVRNGATDIILEIDTYGGLLESAIQITKLFSHELNAKVNTVAYVPDKAISAGAMAALSCRHIVVGPHGKIGASAPVTTMGEMDDTMRAKVESVLRSEFRGLAEMNGWPVNLVEAMVTRPDAAIFRVFNKREGRFEYLSEKLLPADAGAYDLATKTRVLPEKQLLTMTGRETFDYGFADAVVGSVDEIAAALGLPAVSEVHTAPERRMTAGPVVVGVALALGMLGLLMGLKTGSMEALLLGVGGFAGFFALKHGDGGAEIWEITIALLGLATVVVELFFMVGGGTLIPVGGGVFALGIVMCMLPPISEWGFGGEDQPPAPAPVVRPAPATKPTTVPGSPAVVPPSPDPAGNPPSVPAPAPVPVPRTTGPGGSAFGDALGQALATLVLSFAGALMGLWVILSNLHRIPGLRRLVHTGGGAEPRLVPADGQSPFAKGGEDGRKLRLGEIGTTETALRPAGKARFGDDIIDVVAEGAFLDRGTSVQVVGMESTRILVRRA